MAGGLMGGSRRCARALLNADLVSYIASDAHRVEHYDLLARAMRDYGSLLRE
jgi:protein-tyrosine phosphatase